MSCHCPKKVRFDTLFSAVQSHISVDIVRNLTQNFVALSQISGSNNILINVYHPSLKVLYSHFISTLCDVCYPFTHNPQELQYIAAARWPGFRKPLLDQYKEYQAANDGDVDMDSGELEFGPPSDEARMRLSRLFNSTLTTALDALLPRLSNASDWARDNEPPDGILSLPRGQHPPQVVQQSDTNMNTLPRISKFILIASFLASTNPPKTDLRMFGRGVDERKRKRRVTKATGKTKSGGIPKVV